MGQAHWSRTSFGIVFGRLVRSGFRRPAWRSEEAHAVAIDVFACRGVVPRFGCSRAGQRRVRAPPAGQLATAAGREAPGLVPAPELGSGTSFTPASTHVSFGVPIRDVAHDDRADSSIRSPSHYLLCQGHPLPYRQEACRGALARAIRRKATPASSCGAVKIPEIF